MFQSTARANIAFIVLVAFLVISLLLSSRISYTPELSVVPSGRGYDVETFVDTAALHIDYISQGFKIHLIVSTHLETEIEAWNEGNPSSARLASLISKSKEFKAWKDSTDSLLNSLLHAEYEGDRVAVTFLASSNNPFVLQLVRSYISDQEWILGPKSVLTQGSLQEFDMLSIYKSATSSEHFLFLSTAVIVKPKFYLELKTVMQRYPSSENLILYGVSLLPLKISAIKNNSSSATEFKINNTFPANHTSPSLMRGIGEDCQLILSPKMSAFAMWHLSKLDPLPIPFSAPPPPTDSEPWKPLKVYSFNSECDNSWRLSMTSLMQSQGGFNVFLPSSSHEGRLLCEPNPRGSAAAGAAQLHDVSGSEGREGSKKTERVTLEKGEEKKRVTEFEDSAHQKAEKNDAFVISGESESLLTLKRYSVCGTEMKSPMLATSYEELKALLKHIHEEKTVIAAMTSTGFEDMLENWLCYVAELDIHNYFIISDSLEQAKRLVKKGHSAFYLHLPSNENEPLDYGTYGYKKFILERTRTVMSILYLRYNVLLADVDAVWLSNPFPHLNDKKMDIMAQLEDYGDLCGGFLFLRGNTRVLKLWKEVTAMFEKAVEDMKLEMTEKPQDIPWLLPKYEAFHEQNFLNILIKRNDSNVRVKGLDKNHFPHGREYFEDQAPQKAGVESVVVHNNFIIGKDKKLARFIRFGLWRVDPHKNACICLHCRLKE